MMYKMMVAIEVYADVACPFTHIGLARFVAEREARGRNDVVLRVHGWPLEVVNGEPLDPEFIAQEIDEITDQVGGGWFDGFDQSVFPATTVPAMALAAAAYDVDDATGEAVSLQLRELLFHGEGDVAEPAVLTRVAHAHSVEFDPGDVQGHRSTVLADHERGKALGVTGSPHFFTPGGDFFCPALAVGRDHDGNLVVSADEEAFDTFVEACFR